MSADAASLAESIIQNITSGFFTCCLEHRVVRAKGPAVVAMETRSAGQASIGLLPGKLFRKALLSLLPGKSLFQDLWAFYRVDRFKVMKVQFLKRNGSG